MKQGIQRASMAKRVSAWLFDVILLAVAAVFFAWALAGAVGFDGWYARLNDSYAAVAAQYGLDVQALSASAYSELTPQMREQVAAANAALAGDGEAVYAYRMVMQLIMLIVSLGIFLAHLALEFLVPLALGEGRTLGKRIFGLALMRSNSVRVGQVGLFIRAILGKYAIETMVCVMAALMFMFGSVSLAALAAALALLLAQAVLVSVTRNHTAIHDLLADTVVVDYASQMIFPTQEAMIAYQQTEQERLAADRAF